MDGVAKRLDEVRGRLGLSGREFSAKAGLGHAQFSKIMERGGGTARTETLRAFAHVANISLHWLITGEGERDPLTAPSSNDADDGDVSHDQLTTTVYHESDPVLGNLGNWQALLSVARQKRPGTPQWAWDAVAESRAQIAGSEMTVAVIVAVLDVTLEVVPPPPEGTTNNRAYYRAKAIEMSTGGLKSLARWARARGVST